ncbi:MAG: Acetyltransferase family [Candidatus Parcubacteria bacterium]|jgi:ribosomal protein S18 acetylase RimI-like enzyme
MHIREATERDVTVVSEMGNKVLAHHATFNPFYQPVVLGYKVPLPPEKIVLVATTDSDTVIGCIQGVFHKEPQDRSYPFAVIQSIWVDEVVRGQKIAQSLIATFEEIVKGKGARQVDMFVDVQNNLGLALWDAVGYKTYQEKRRKLI